MPVELSNMTKKIILLFIVISVIVIAFVAYQFSKKSYPTTNQAEIAQAKAIEAAPRLNNILKDLKVPYVLATNNRYSIEYDPGNFFFLVRVLDAKCDDVRSSIKNYFLGFGVKDVSKLRIAYAQDKKPC